MSSKKIGVYSDLLPGGAPVYDLTDIEARIYSFVDRYEPNGSVEPGMLKSFEFSGRMAKYSRADQTRGFWGI